MSKQFSNIASQSFMFIKLFLCLELTTFPNQKFLFDGTCSKDK